MKEILLKHYHLYPKMKIEDMIKLIYQNEFAGGHMIKDEEHSLERLIRECDEIKNEGLVQPMFEEIGNSLYRLNLHSLRGVKLSTINKFFVNTANNVKGTIKDFEAKLECLKTCIINKELPYSIDEFESYLSEYKKHGYPPVHHSDVYRNTYCPAYRIVKAEYHDYFDVFNQIDCLLNSNKKILIGIDGNSGAGKSMLAKCLSEVYDVNIFTMDDFFLTPELRTEERLNECGGNVDYIRFRKEVIEKLKNDIDFYYAKYDCKTNEFIDSKRIKPKIINIIEGVYSLHPTLVDEYDLKIFLNITKDEQKERIRIRNGEAMLCRFINEWIPLENVYFDGFDIINQCDLVYYNNRRL